MREATRFSVFSLTPAVICLLLFLGGVQFGTAPNACAEDAVYYIYNDHLGTPVKATDEEGNVVWDGEARPFGETEVNTGILTVNPRFPGQYYDKETGLHYNYQRTYHPGLGRYLEPDPLGQRNSPNVYLYVGNNPLNLIDPFGLYESHPWLMVVPGQYQYDLGRTAIENGQYRAAAVYFSAMLGEQVLFALSFGQSAAIRGGSQCVMEGSALASKSIPPLRQQYVDAVEALANKVPGMRATGMNSEQIARAMHAERRALGVQFKNLTDPKMLEQIYQRNLAEYGDKLGPTIDWLRKHNKSWDDIIESATRTGGKDLGF